jgi:hypothetical protein
MGEIGAAQDLEIQPLQRGGHIVGVVARILQLLGMFVAGITDDQRHALLRLCTARESQQQNQTDSRERLRIGIGPQSPRLRCDRL